MPSGWLPDTGQVLAPTGVAHGGQCDLDGRLGLALSETEACAVIPLVVACIETATTRGPE